MRVNNNLITSQPSLHHHCMNLGHIHFICPFKFCSCTCSVCNYYFGCPCKCHRITNRKNKDNLSFKNDNNILNKTPLSNFSKNLYEKDSYRTKNNDYDYSPEKIDNQNYFPKRMFHDKLDKELENNRSMRIHRSLPEINSVKNSFENDKYKYNNLPEDQKYFGRSYIRDLYKINKKYKRSYYSPPSENNMTFKNKFYDSDNDNYFNIRAERSEERHRHIKGYPFEDYEDFNTRSIDYSVNNYRKEKNNIDDFYKKYHNNDYNKRHKYRNYLNSTEKDKDNDKIQEIIINRKRKDVYLSLDPDKNKNKINLEKYIKNNDKKFQTYKDYNSFNENINNNLDDNNNYNERNKLSFNNNDDSNDFERNDKYYHSNDFSYPKQYEKLYDKNNKYLNNKLNNKIYDYKNNFNDNISKYNTIKNEDLYNNKSYNKNFIHSNNYKINSFFLTINGINNNLPLINIEEYDDMKRQLIQKDEEILEYKDKINSLMKELDFSKNEIKKLKERLQNQNNNNNNILNQRENRYIYRKKSTDEKINFNEKNNYKKDSIINRVINKNIKEEISKNNNNNDNYNNFKINKNIKNNNKQFGLSSKLNIKTDLNISKDTDYFSSYSQKQILSDKCIYAISPLTKSKSFLCFDYTDKSFSFRDYADFGDFQENYTLSFEDNKDKDKSINDSIFLVVKYNFFIVTGENCDMLYVYNSLKRTINKLCSLKNNHSKGSLINYSDKIICISGNYNKKVELYNQSKNEWINLPELLIERSSFATCVIKNKYIFCLFGYNFPTKQYLNTIEFIDIQNYEKSSWKYLYYKNENLLSLYITDALGMNYNDEKIIIVGGNDGKENIPNEYFYQIILCEDFQNNDKSYVEKVQRKLKDINKNKCYLFNKGYNIFSNNKNLYYMAFDNNLRSHLFQISNMAHDVFCFD